MIYIKNNNNFNLYNLVKGFINFLKIYNIKTLKIIYILIMIFFLQIKIIINIYIYIYIFICKKFLYNIL